MSPRDSGEAPSGRASRAARPNWSRRDLRWRRGRLRDGVEAPRRRAHGSLIYAASPARSASDRYLCDGFRSGSQRGLGIRPGIPAARADGLCQQARSLHQGHRAPSIMCLDAQRGGDSRSRNDEKAPATLQRPYPEPSPEVLQALCPAAVQASGAGPPVAGAAGTCARQSRRCGPQATSCPGRNRSISVPTAPRRMIMSRL